MILVWILLALLAILVVLLLVAVVRTLQMKPTPPCGPNSRLRPGPGPGLCRGLSASCSAKRSPTFSRQTAKVRRVPQAAEKEFPPCTAGPN